MPQIRRTGIFLHTGNPESKARTPRSGGRDVKSSGTGDPGRLPKPKSTPKKSPKSGPLCSWCGSPAKKSGPGSQPRCRRCKRLEAVISNAATYLGQYGLRPLGSSTESDSPDEAAHRKAASAARRELNSVRKSRTAKAPTGRAKRKLAQTASPESKSSPVDWRAKNQPKRTRLPGPGHDDHARILRTLVELDRRIEAERRSGVLETGGGRARFAQLQQQRHELASKAAKIQARARQR